LPAVSEARSICRSRARLGYRLKKGKLSQLKKKKRKRMKRRPEPELMDSEAQTRAYAEADFEEANNLFAESSDWRPSNWAAGSASARVICPIPHCLLPLSMH